MHNTSNIIRDKIQEELKAGVLNRVDRMGVPTKFGKYADNLRFSRQGLEVASRFIIAKHRFSAILRDIEANNLPHIADITAGIGGDCVAALELGCNLTAYETDPDVFEILQYNLQIVHNLCSKQCSIANTSLKVMLNVIDEGANHSNLPNNIDVIFADPMRRNAHSKAISIENYLPSVPQIALLYSQYLDKNNHSNTVLCVKFSPATSHVIFREIVEYFSKTLQAVQRKFEVKITHYSIDGESVESTLIITPKTIGKFEMSKTEHYAIIIDSKTSAEVIWKQNKEKDVEIANITQSVDISQLEMIADANLQKLQKIESFANFANLTELAISNDIENNAFFLLELDSAINSAHANSSLQCALLQNANKLSLKLPVVDFFKTSTAYILVKCSESVLNEIRKSAKIYRILAIEKYNVKRFKRFVTSCCEILQGFGVCITDFEIKQRGVKFDVHSMQVSANKIAKSHFSALQSVRNITKTRGTLIINGNLSNSGAVWIAFGVLISN